MLTVDPALLFGPLPDPPATCIRPHLHCTHCRPSRFIHSSLHSALGTDLCLSSTADKVQEIYLTELKAYKLPIPKASDSEGQVKKWSVPAVPGSPEQVEASLTEQLKAYEAQEVEVEGQGEATQDAVEEDWFEEEATFGEPETAAH